MFQMNVFLRLCSKLVKKEHLDEEKKGRNRGGICKVIAKVTKNLVIC